jgi:hypothetical protein
MQRTRNHANFAASLRECAALGSSVDLSVADSVDEPVDIEIERIGGIHESSIFELSNGLTGCMLESSLTNQAKRRIYCPEIHIRLSWTDFRVDWEVGESDFYRFPGKNSLELPRDQVLNHVVLARSGLEPQRFHEGWFVATGGPMPETLRHGQLIDATLAITTSHHTECSAIFSLWTERLEDRPRRAERKYDLFGEPVGHDIGPMVAARAEAQRRE